MSKPIPTPRREYKRMRISLLLLFSFSSFYAQHGLKIAYGEKINLGNVDAKIQFEVNGIHLKGKAINDYVFATPGIYHIKVTEKKSRKADSCEGLHLPKDIAVTVSRIRMTFSSDQVAFSSPILRNIETAGTMLSIPVTIETYDHLPALLDFTPVNAAGIGVSIVANLDASVTELPEGIHTLHYALHGIVTENSYLMFDFVDANGKVQPVSLVTPVKS